MKPCTKSVHCPCHRKYLNKQSSVLLYLESFTDLLTHQHLNPVKNNWVVPASSSLDTCLKFRKQIVMVACFSRTPIVTSRLKRDSLFVMRFQHPFGHRDIIELVWRCLDETLSLRAIEGAASSYCDNHPDWGASYLATSQHCCCPVYHCNCIFVVFRSFEVVRGNFL